MRPSIAALVLCAGVVSIARAGVFVPGFPNDPSLHPEAVSADGSVVVGYMNTAQGDDAFVWHPGGAVLQLENVLTSNGVLGVADWDLTMATMLSPDGREICGWGLNPISQSAPWMATNQPADLNLDWRVDIFDVNLVSSNWGTSNPQGDANGDGDVNIFDINAISATWGQPGIFSANVPVLPPQPGQNAEAAEPATLAIWTILDASALAIARWRRRLIKR